jgi:hypothetical protein
MPEQHKQQLLQKARYQIKLAYRSTNFFSQKLSVSFLQQKNTTCYEEAQVKTSERKKIW